VFIYFEPLNVRIALTEISSAKTDSQTKSDFTAVRKYSAAAHNLLEKSYKGGNGPKEL